VTFCGDKSAIPSSIVQVPAFTFSQLGEMENENKSKHQIYDLDRRTGCDCSADNAVGCACNCCSAKRPDYIYLLAEIWNSARNGENSLSEIRSSTNDCLLYH
jgi:hypothetical protein